MTNPLDASVDPEGSYAINYTVVSESIQSGFRYGYAESNFDSNSYGDSERQGYRERGECCGGYRCGGGHAAGVTSDPIFHGLTPLPLLVHGTGKAYFLWLLHHCYATPGVTRTI